MPLPLDVENAVSEEFYERRNQESNFPGVYYYPVWVGIQLACRCPWLWRRLLATPCVLRLAAPLLSTSDSLCTRCAALCASPAPGRLWRTTRLPTATCLASFIPLWLALIRNIGWEPCKKPYLNKKILHPFKNHSKKIPCSIT